MQLTSSLSITTNLKSLMHSKQMKQFQSEYSYLWMNELLMYYINHECGHQQSTVTRYGHTYLKVSGYDIYDLCIWIKRLHWTRSIRRYIHTRVYKPPEGRRRNIRLPQVGPYYVLGEVLKTVLPYLERAADAMHSRLPSTSHTVPADRPSLCQLVVWLQQGRQC